MKNAARLLLSVSCLLVAHAARPARGSGFTAFAEDEDVCRRAGAAAIGDAAGPVAARRYDSAHQRCMFMQIRRRQMRVQPPEPPVGSNTVGFPDAYFAVPYATQGYGYDGFSPY